LDDPTVPPESLVKSFTSWVSAYWERFTTLDEITESAVAKQRDMATLSSEPQYQATCSRMTRQELEAVIHPAAALRMGHPGHISLSVYGRNARKSLMDTNGAWRNVKALVLWADMSCAYCPWGAKVFVDQLNEPAGKGEMRRDIKVVQLKNANHFVSRFSVSGFLMYSDALPVVAL
jgi:hypothetical protein